MKTPVMFFFLKIQYFWGIFAFILLGQLRNDRKGGREMREDMRHRSIGSGVATLLQWRTHTVLPFDVNMAHSMSKTNKTKGLFAVQPSC